MLLLLFAGGCHEVLTMRPGALFGIRLSPESLLTVLALLPPAAGCRPVHGGCREVLIMNFNLRGC
jgi:hypothetical protein